MKLTTVLLLTTCLQATAGGYAQNFNISLREAPIEKVFNEIQKQSDYRFFYNERLLKQTKSVTLRVRNASLEKVLELCFNNQPITYEIDQTQIVVKPKEILEEESSGTLPLVLSPPPIMVTGKVTDEDGTVLSGASVKVKGSNEGVSTDANGNFSLQLSENQKILVISYVGYESQEIRVSAGNANALTIVLQTSESSMQDIVVIGYGKQKRKDLTGAVSSVSSKDLADIPMARIDHALEGFVPGLDIVPSGYNPGDEVQTRLRGNRSITASNNPLIILDGIPFYGSLNDINPQDVASVDVLKDASSTAIYGSQGSNGVIIVTTKRGKTGKPQFAFESYTGIQKIYGPIPFQNGEQYAEKAREALRAAGSYTDPKTNDALDQQFFTPMEYAYIQSGKWEDWQSDLLQNGHLQSYQLSVMGGTNAVKYNISGNYYNNEGNMPGRAFDRYTLRSNLDFTLSRRITAGTSVLLNYNLIKARIQEQALNQAQQASPLGKPYNDDGTPQFYPTSIAGYPNPLANILWDSYRYNNKRWSGYINAFAEVNIFSGLTYRIQLSDNISLNNISTSTGTYLVTGISKPSANITDATSNQKVYESILTYNRFFHNTDHQLTITAVQSFQNSKNENLGASVTDLPYEPSRYSNIGTAATINSVSSDLVETTLKSYVGRIFYGYKSKYLVTLSLRADGASQFAPNHKWGYFPSAALAWRISEENFLKASSFLSDLKLRLSYGVTGNQGIKPYQTQGGLASTIYAWDEGGAFGYRPAALANKNLKWESTEVYNLGIDFGFLDGRINGNIEVYNTNTYDLLMQRKLPITSGFDEVLENVGNTNNKGFELGLNTANIAHPNFKWNSIFTFTLNREKIVELYNGKVDDIGNLWFIGHPIYVFYDFQKTGIWQTAEATEAASYSRQPGQIKLADLDGNGVVNDLDRTILGTRQPKFISTLVNQFKYMNWDLSAMVYVRWGSTMSVSTFVPASGKTYNVPVLDYWTPNNPTNDSPRPDERYLIGLNASTLGYRDGSFIRLKYMSLGYTLPRTVFGMNTQSLFSKARIYLSGENLLYWTKSEVRKYNIDPELSVDVPFGTLPAFRTILVGLDFNF